MASTSPPERPTVLSTLLLIVGIVPFMAGLTGLYALLHVGFTYCGFLFLLYWAAMKQQAPAEYLPSVLGGITGIGLGWMLSSAPAAFGTPGIALSVAVMVVVLFCYTRGHAYTLVSNATMLFLVVATIPEVGVTATAPMMIASLLVAAAYMGAVALLMHALQKRRAAKQIRTLA